jgi:hypothetical protein
MDKVRLEWAKAVTAKADARKRKQAEANKRAKDREKADLAEALRVIADAERAAKANGHDVE